MMGLGDNLHQRAVMKQLAKEHNEIFLETPWPTLYWDIPEVKPCKSNFSLRTQLKNSKREMRFYVSQEEVPKKRYDMSITYTPEKVRRYGSVLGAMCAQCKVLPMDFEFTPQPEWNESVDKIINGFHTDKPLMIYRPLVERKEWGGCRNRNPDIEAYYNIFQSINDKYFVISIADLEKEVEWMTSIDVKADVEFHSGELSINQLAVLFQRSALVYTSPGFSVVLAQAVRTPVITVFGGYENSSSFSYGAKYSPYLGIDPIKSCQCFSHSHQCQKTIDVPVAIEKVREFTHANVR